MGEWSRARFTGFVYLVYFLTATLAEFLLLKGLRIPSEIASLVAYLLYLAVTLLFYRMFKPVDARISGVAALFSLAGCALGVVTLFHVALNGTNQLFFFGLYCCLIGYLIFRSGFLPRLLGILMILGGVGWLASLSPFAHSAYRYIEFLGIVAEGSLMLWLLIVGPRIRSSPARS